MPTKQYGKVADYAADASIAGTETLLVLDGTTTKSAALSAIAGYANALPLTVSVLTPAAGVVTIDLSLGDYFTLAPTANVTSIVFTNLPGSGKGTTKMIRFTQDTTPRTVAWPASFRWEGAAPSVSTGSGAVDVLSITTFDNGTKWDATLSKGRA